MKKENNTVCKTVPLSFEDFQSYFVAIVQDESVIQSAADSGKALTVLTRISFEGVHRKFVEPKTDEEEVSQARESAIPTKIRQDTAYCMRMWDEWASFTNGRPGTSTSYVPSPIQLAIDPPNLQYWLSHFCLEATKKDGSEFPPNLLHHIICGLMQYILRQIILSGLPLPHTSTKLKLMSSWSWKGWTTGAWRVFEAINVHFTNKVLHSLTY